MPLVKVNGITNWEDAKAAVDAGADILGFVCDEYSPRVVAPHVFQEIASRLPPRIVRVGIFDRVTDPRWLAAGRSVLQQFHQVQYSQDSVWSDVVGENWEMGRKIKAFELNGDKDMRQIAGFNGLVQAFLLNVYTKKAHGFADSEAYGWELARETRQFGKRIYLAGGLTQENVARAISRVQPYAVDVTVSVEAAPGVLDADKLREFVNAVRQAETKT